jgi:hypothetical protein
MHETMFGKGTKRGFEKAQQQNLIPRCMQDTEGFCRWWICKRTEKHSGKEKTI